MSGPETVVPPPDGGWAWMIALSAFYCNFMIMGLIKCYGVFMVEFREIFPDITTQEVALINSFAFGCALFFAPLTSNLARLIGYRKEMCVGGFMAFLGYAMSLFCTEFYQLYFTMGALFGIGGSLIWIPAIASSGLYFEKHRNAAMGLIGSSSGLSGFILPPFIQYLLKEYDYKSTLLLISGLLLNLVPAGALYRAPEDIKPPKQRRLELARLQANKFERLDRQKSSENVLPNSPSESKDKLVIVTVPKKPTALSSTSLSLLKADVVYASCHSLPVNEFQAEELNSQRQEHSCWRKFYKSVTNRKVQLVKFGLVFNHQLQSLTICLMMAFLSYPNFYNFLPVHSLESGYTKEDGALLISITSIVEVLTRLTVGFVWDTRFVRDRVGYANIYASGVAVSGIFATALTASNNYVYMAVCSSLYGAISASYILSTPAMLVQLLGLENLVPSTGLLFWAQSFVAFMGPPIFGKIRDLTGDCKAVFYVMTVLQLFGGLAMGISMPFARRAENRKLLESQSKPNF